MSRAGALLNEILEKSTDSLVSSDLDDEREAFAKDNSG